MALQPQRKGVAGLAIAGAVIGLVAAALRGRLARFEVADHSMQPALNPGDYLVAVSARRVARGDIVVFADPAHSGRDYVKRIVGLSGERITLDGGQVAIDGDILAEPWADGPTLPDGEWTNPVDTVFVIGDNRALSSGDSRTVGPVATMGMYRVVLRYWPLGSVGRV